MYSSWLTVQGQTPSGNKIMADVHPVLTTRQAAGQAGDAHHLNAFSHHLSRLRVLYGIFDFAGKKKESERTDLSRTIELSVNGAKV